ncbi:MAG: glycerophosphodiester phosphodiesterase family protein [Bacteroidetes bacterium]|nr:glycerophosphodiester phosphodiesterase family protein [Bacteroidota bacterium]MBS1973744.1 glycerophosphodiester phosphodiesterase family protein [Bacteroidota bacterium]
MRRNMILLFCLCCYAEAFSQSAKLPVARHKFIIIAHRGDHIEVPENTLAAYENAIRHEADFVEIDLRTTKDSILVIMHDATVDRMTNGKGKVSNLSFAEIRRLQITDKKNASSKNYLVPTFEEVLKTCRNKIHIYLDFKNASVQQAYNMIKKYGMKDQVIVYINEPFQYTEWRKTAPSMPLMVSLPDDIKSEAALKSFLAKNPVELLDGDYTDYNQATLAAAKQLGIAVWPDIQSAEEHKNWDKAILFGFTEGLQTDHPQALAEYLKKKGLR